MTTTIDLLGEILAREYQIDSSALTRDTPLETLGIDSLDIAELLFTIEDEFSVKMSNEPAKLSTIGEVVAYIDTLIATQRGHAGQAIATVKTA